MKKKLSLLCLTLALTVALSACGGGAGTSSTAGVSNATGTASSGATTTDGPKSITIAQESEVANLNPSLFPRTPDQNIQTLIFDPLVGPLGDLTFEGILAKSWEISEDGTVYTFLLNDNVKWHDGVAFTAKDVAFTLNSFAKPSYVGGRDYAVSSIKGSDEAKAGTADSISGIEVVDDFTIKITLKTPDASFLSAMFVYILPEHILGAVDPGVWEKDPFNRNPIGTGKYKFVKWESGQYIQMEKNTEYFGKQPSIDTIFYRFGDITTLTTALMNGEVDLVEAVAPSEIETLNASGIATAITYPRMTMYYVGLNQQNEFLSDLKVRQALSHALDKDKIINTVFGEYANATNDLFPDIHWSHNPDVTVYPYDTAKAEGLLQEAGFTKNAAGIYEKGGKPLKFVFDMVKKNQEQDNIAQLIQQAWKAIGVDLEIRTQDFATLAFTRLLPKDSAGVSRAVTAEDYDMFTLGFGVEVDPDEYRNYFITSGAPPNGMNFGNYSNPEVDKLFAESITMTDQNSRAEVFHKIAKIFSDDIPWIPLYCDVGVVGVSNKVENCKFDFRPITYQIADWNIK